VSYRRIKTQVRIVTVSRASRASRATKARTFGIYGNGHGTGPVRDIGAADRVSSFFANEWREPPLTAAPAGRSEATV
jgi:hypothetical protein